MISHRARSTASIVIAVTLAVGCLVFAAILTVMVLAGMAVSGS